MKDLRKQTLHTLDGKYGSADHACSDQFSSGIPIGSLYYPRIVTAILWLEEHAAGQKQAESSHDASEEVSAV